jgi:hypothetical protein
LVKPKSKCGKVPDRVELELESPWKLLEKAVQTKFKHGYEKGTDIHILLSNPHTVNPIIALADKSEVPAILCKIIDDIDVDRHRAKQLLRSFSPAIIHSCKILKNPNRPALVLPGEQYIHSPRVCIEMNREA